jgi:hypothetical protein
MCQRKQIAFEASPPVDVGLRPNALDQIGEDVSTYQLKSKTRRNGTLSDEVDRINDLRVSKAQATHSAGFDAQVNAIDEVCANDPTVFAKLIREIDILLPTVQDEALIKPDLPDLR